MITIKIFIPVYILVIGSDVLCDGDLEDIRVSRQYVPLTNRQRYQFNHPPLFASSYQPIPVAVVYEDTSRNEKSLTTKTDKKSPALDKNGTLDSNKITEKHPIDLNTESISETTISKSTEQLAETTEGTKQMTPELVKDTTLIKNSKDIQIPNTTTNKSPKSRNRVNRRKYPETELQIPVMVVYEEPQIIRTNKKNIRKDPTSERISSFSLKKINETNKNDVPITTFRPLHSKTPRSVGDSDGSSSILVQGKFTVGPEATQGESLAELNEKQKPNSRVAKSDAGRIRKHNNHERLNTQHKNVDATPLVESSNTNRRSTSLNNYTTEVQSNANSTRRQKIPVVPIIDSENKVYAHSGVFQYSYEGGDGTKAYSEGKLKTFDEEKTGEAVSGGFSYKDKDGTDYSLTYTADENGYRPVGDHLPTPPPIPPAIARALAYLATKTTPEPVTEAYHNGE